MTYFCSAVLLTATNNLFMQGTNLLSYYSCDLFFLYFNAIYVVMLIAFDSVTTPYFCKLVFFIHSWYLCTSDRNFWKLLQALLKRASFSFSQSGARVMSRVSFDFG